MKKLLYAGFISKILRTFFSLFYDRKYLQGYYFDTKRAGWIWAWKGLWQKRPKTVNWPISGKVTISGTKKILFDPDDLHIFQSPGCYFQVIDGNISIGKGSWIAPNVGIITTNHDINDLLKHQPGCDVVIGKNCWIGMNAVVLPGVTLGDHTVVGAGAVVTKSFPDGNCVLGGVPAKVIKTLDPIETSR